MLTGDAMHTTTVTIDAEDSLPQAALSMQTLGVRRLLVLSENRVVGLVADGEVRRALLQSPQEPLSQAPLRQPHLQQLPPGRQQVSHEDMFQAAASTVVAARVSQIMTRRVFTVRAEDDLRQAIGTMLERHVGGLPVLGRDGALVGMLTLTDVLRAAAHLQPGWGTADWGSVRRHMSTGAVTVSPDTPLAEAAARLVGTRLRVLPVIQGQTLVGVLHQQDIQADVARQQAAHRSAPSACIPRGPAQPVHVQQETEAGGGVDTKDFSVLQGRTARDLMCPPGAEILAEAPLLEAIQTMLDADVHGLPVVNGDAADGDPHQFLGVLTVSDVLQALLTDRPRRAEHA